MTASSRSPNSAAGRVAVGLGQRRPFDRIAAQRRQRRCAWLSSSVYDPPKPRRPRQLTVHQSHELALGRQSPHPAIRPMRRHQPLKCRPRNTLQQIMENAILMPHGVASEFVSSRRVQRLNTSRINTVQPVQKI